MKITNPHHDPDVIALRRIFAAAKMHRSQKNKRVDHYLSGQFDDTPYFQAGLAQLKKCREEGILK